MGNDLEERVSSPMCGFNLRHQVPSFNANAEYANRCCHSRDCDYQVVGKDRVKYCAYVPVVKGIALAAGNPLFPYMGRT